MEKKRGTAGRENIVIGWGLLAFSLLLIFVIFPTQITPQPGELVSSSVFPNFAAVVLALMAVLFLVDGYKKARRARSGAQAEAAPAREPMNWRAFLNSLLILVCLILAIRYIGFVVSSLLFLTLCMRLFKAGGWLKCLLIAIVITGALYLIFHTFMLIKLPPGVITEYILDMF